MVLGLADSDAAASELPESVTESALDVAVWEGFAVADALAAVTADVDDAPVAVATVDAVADADVVDSPLLLGAGGSVSDSLDVVV